MEPYRAQHDLLTTASHLNRAGRQLVPLLRALPATMRRTCADLATSLTETAEKRGLAGPGLGVARQIDALIAGCDHAFAAGKAGAEAMAQTRALRDRLTDVQEILAWLDDQLAARGEASPPRLAVDWRYDRKRRGPRRPAEDLIRPARSRTSPRSIGGQESVETMPLHAWRCCGASDGPSQTVVSRGYTRGREVPGNANTSRTPRTR